jgi:hypothetical protein
MSSDYPNLVKCCGGRITPEAIEQFQRAMVEYKTFVDDMLRLIDQRGTGSDAVESTASATNTSA